MGIEPFIGKAILFPHLNCLYLTYFTEKPQKQQLSISPSKKCRRAAFGKNFLFNFTNDKFLNIILKKIAKLLRRLEIPLAIKSVNFLRAKK
jgi:hypothetical protein